MRHTLMIMLAAAALLVPPTRPASTAGRSERGLAAECWPGTTWDELGIAETFALPSS